MRYLRLGSRKVKGNEPVASFVIFDVNRTGPFIAHWDIDTPENTLCCRGDMMF